MNQFDAFEQVAVPVPAVAFVIRTEQESPPATIRSTEAAAVPVQIPWFSTVETLHHGYWGKIEVLGKDAERAAKLIDDFLAATPEEIPGEES